MPLDTWHTETLEVIDLNDKNKKLGTLENTVYNYSAQHLKITGNGEGAEVYDTRLRKFNGVIR